MSKIIISALAIVLIFSIAIAAKDTPQKGEKDAPQPSIPQLINYQGKLTDNAGNPQNGNFDMTFKIYNAAIGGTEYWNETQTGVTVTNGLFNVILGSVTLITNFPLGPNCYLEITVNGQLISPRQRIVSNGYSYYADEADNAAALGGIPASNYVVRPVQTADIADGAATNAKIGANAVTTDKIQDGTIQQADLSFTPATRPLTPPVATAEIADGAVTLAKHADNSVNSAKIVDASIGTVDLNFTPATRPLTPGVATGEIADGAVTTAKIADNAVNSIKIQDGQIQTADIADLNVTTGKIADGAVTLAKHADNSVNSAKIVDASVATADISDGAVTTPKIAANDVTLSRIERGTTAGAAIISQGAGADPTWGNPTPAAHTHTASGDVTGTVTGTLTIASDAVNSAKIADGTVADADLTNTGVTSGVYTNTNITVNAQGRISAAASGSAGIGGSGTANYIPKFTAPTTLGNSGIFETGGNIGIGTTGPTYKLEVYKDDGVLGGEHPTSYIGGSNAAGILIGYLANGATRTGGFVRSLSGMDLSIGAGAYNQAIFIGQTVGNVGIGFNAPASRLTVNGGATFGNAYASTAMSDGNVAISGNVGIGTLTPGSKLQVNGNAVIGYSASTAGPSNGLAVSGKVGIGITTPFCPLQIGVIPAEGNWFTEGAQRPLVGATIAGSIDQDQSRSTVLVLQRPGINYVTWAGLVRFDLSKWEASGLVSRTQLDVRLGHGDLNNEVTPTIMSLRSNGNVGIGTTTPTANLHVIGNFIATGTKSAVVKTTKGDVALYCQESPENWFEDFGEGKLINGHTRIELDKLFLETVTINDQYPMKVFIQLEDNCNGVYVRKDKTGFDVYELQSGTSNATFTYRVVAKRKGFEDLRLKMQGTK